MEIVDIISMTIFCRLIMPNTVRNMALCCSCCNNMQFILPSLAINLVDKIKLIIKKRYKMKA